MGEFQSERHEPRPDRNLSFIRGKHMMDGAKTLEEAARMLRNEAIGLEKLAKQRWRLVAPVEDDYGTIRKR